MKEYRTEQIKSLKELLKLKQKGFDLYESESSDMYGGGRVYKLRVLEPLGDGRFANKQLWQRALDEILERSAHADYPKSCSRMEKERNFIRLVLSAGANPNSYAHCYNQNIFGAFFDLGKVYGALEIAKSPNFEMPGNLDSIFETLSDRLTYYLKNGKHSSADTPEEDKLKATVLADRKALVCTLFEKNMFPRDKAVFEKLAPIILEKDPEFFNKKKLQVLTQMKCAKTPSQIYAAFLVNRKEKN